MTTDGQLPLFGDEPETAPGGQPAPTPGDEAARRHAADPRHNVVLEASAGTGKTSVLVARYLNLLRAGADPSNILAITFTRKAAAEMRDRLIEALREAAGHSAADRRLWLDLRHRLGDVAISTIDAFCYGLLREFPLEADLDPGFTMTDETGTARLVEETLDHTLRAARRLATSDEAIALLLAHLPPFRLRDGFARLLDRRLVAWAALDRYLTKGPADLTPERACRTAVATLLSTLDRAEGGLEAFLRRGPVGHPRFRLFAADVERARRGAAGQGAAAGDWVWLRAVVDAARHLFLTEKEQPRQRPAYVRAAFEGPADYDRHKADVARLAPSILDLHRTLNRHLNIVLARAVRTLFAIALREYERVLAEYDVLDFSGALSRAVRLLAQMDEFAQSRYRLQSRYHHVLVDEFQDTSRLQWDLVSYLVRSWGEGFGLVHEAPVPPTVFVVGDRKQSIYRFRDAEVALLDDADAAIAGLRQEGTVRQFISTSFRAVPRLLAFANALFTAIEKAPAREDAFRYEEGDRFPVPDESAGARAASDEEVLGLFASEEAEQSAAVAAAEIVRLLATEQVRDPHTGLRRPVRPGDIAILFRSRESHREFEQALQRAGVPTYVYKGLGFFDADEIKDVTATMRLLARPESSLRAAAFLRTRLVGLSDAGLARLQPALADALTARDWPAAADGLDAADRSALALARESLERWLPLVDRLPPAELVDLVLAESAYAVETRGPRRLQARENLKKLRALLRRIQNNGYATLGRIADHVDRLSAGDESNAMVEALDAVSLMTIHASKGLQFPVVFLVNLARGAGAVPPAIRFVADAGRGEPEVGVWPYQGAVDEVEGAREIEETKRLLYVAVTRARDRLYLATLVRDGQLRPGRGSLAAVLPARFAALFSEAARLDAACGGRVVWHTDAGETFGLRVPAVPAAGESAAAAPSPLHSVAVGALASRPGSVELEPLVPHASTVCRLVHRRLETHAAADDPPAADEPKGWPAELRLVPEADRATVVDLASRLSRAIGARGDLGRRLRAPSRFGIPLSGRLGAGETIVARDVLEWLVEEPDGSLLVVQVDGGRDVEGEADDLPASPARRLAWRRTVLEALEPGRAVNLVRLQPL